MLEALKSVPISLSYKNIVNNLEYLEFIEKYVECLLFSPFVQFYFLYGFFKLSSCSLHRETGLSGSGFRSAWGGGGGYLNKYVL